MKLGIALGGAPRDIASAARDAERAGFESAWLAEIEHSAFVQAAAAISATERITIGTGVALAFPRSPTITAMEAADLAALSGGRFALGLGSQVRRIVEERFAVAYDPPAARLEDYVRAVRAVWAAGRGEATEHTGPYYRLTRLRFGQPPAAADAAAVAAASPGPLDPPILLAAVGPLMSRVAGRVADGVVGHPLASPAWLRATIAPAIREGLAEAGRPADACPISATPLVAIAEDVDRARRAARLQLAFYATTPNYAGILRLHGREAVVGEVRRAFVRGDHDRMVAAIDDELLDAIAIAGPIDEARERLAPWRGVADRAILAPPWYGLDAAFERELWAAIRETFATG